MIMRKQVMMLACAAVIGLMGINVPANAQLLFVGSGMFLDGSSTVGAIPVPKLTTFTFSEAFNPAADVYPLSVVGVYLGEFTFNITGIGTFTTNPGADIGMGLINFGGGFYMVAITESTFIDFGAGFFGGPPIDADAPSPGTFFPFIGPNSSLGLVTPLAGGAGNLTWGDFDVNTASIVPSGAAPEGSSVAMLALGLVPVAGVMIKRRRRCTAAE